MSLYRSMARFGGLFLWAIRSIPSLARGLLWICARGPVGEARRRLAIGRAQSVLAVGKESLLSALPWRRSALYLLGFFSFLGLLAGSLALAQNRSGEISLVPIEGPASLSVIERQFRLVWATRPAPAPLIAPVIPLRSPIQTPPELPEAASAARRLGLSLAPIPAKSAREPQELIASARQAAPPDSLALLFYPEPFEASASPLPITPQPLTLRALTPASELGSMAHILGSAKIARWSPNAALLAFLDPRSALFLSPAAAEASVDPARLTPEELRSARLGARIAFESIPARARGLSLIFFALFGSLLALSAALFALGSAKDLVLLLAQPLTPAELSGLERAGLLCSLSPPKAAPASVPAKRSSRL